MQLHSPNRVPKQLNSIFTLSYYDNLLIFFGITALVGISSAIDANSLIGEITVTTDGHLPADSPAIDQGQAVASVSDDIDGETRAAPFDIGSDERAPGVLFANGFE